MAGTGFFRVEQCDGRWWLVDPQGAPFISLGVNSVRYQGDYIKGDRMPYNEVVSRKYGGEEPWARAAVERLRNWGFNTIGGNTGYPPSLTWQMGMPYTITLNLGTAFEPDHWLSGKLPNVFDPGFAVAVEKRAEEVCAPIRDDPMVLGYFSDNELHWAPDWRRSLPVLDEYLTFPSGTPGKREAIALLRERYHDELPYFCQMWGCRIESWDALEAGGGAEVVARQNGKRVEADRDAFVRLAAEKYFATCAAAVRRVDPNHLLLGDRLAGYVTTPVLKACRDHVDVISFQTYEWVPPYDMLDTIYRLTGRPIMITEFSFKAMDSGLPNTFGGGRPVATQEDRAAGYERYVRGMLSLRYMVGLHWFKYCDQPKVGRKLDGEDCNYGLVTIDDDPYELLTERMRRVNAEALAIHEAARDSEEQV